MSDFDRGIAQKGLPSVDPAAITPDIASARAVLRSAAVDLGRFYGAVESKDRPLGAWALPTARTVTDEPIIPQKLDRTTEKIFGSDLNVNQRFRKYFADFSTAISAVQKKAWEVAQTTLSDQVMQLRILRAEIAEPGFSKWMHEAADKINLIGADCRESLITNERLRAKNVHADPRFDPRARADLNAALAKLGSGLRQCLVQATDSFIKSDQFDNNALLASQASLANPLLAPQASRKRHIEALQILFTHKEFDKIVAAYGKSADDGTALAGQLILEAENATNNFAESLKLGHVWRYPRLIPEGIQALRLADVQGFQDFVLAIANILAENTLEKPLGYMGIALLIVSTVSGFGVGLTILDLALGGAMTFSNYLRDRQQEFAAKSSAFLPDEKKFASDYSYADTALSFATTALTALSLLRPAARLIKSTTARRMPLKEVPSAPRGLAKEGEAVVPQGRPQEGQIGTEVPVAAENKSLTNDAARMSSNGTGGKQEALVGKGIQDRTGTQNRLKEAIDPRLEASRESATVASLSVPLSESALRVQIMEGLEAAMRRSASEVSGAIAAKDIDYLEKLGLTRTDIRSLVNNTSTYKTSLGRATELATERTIRGDPFLSPYVKRGPQGKVPMGSGKPDWFIITSESVIPVELSTVAETAKRLEGVSRGLFSFRTKWYMRKGVNLSY